MTVDPEDVGARIGRVLAERPDLTTAEVGAAFARAVGEAFGADPERIAATEAVARGHFGRIGRSTFLRMAERGARDDARRSEP